MGKDMDESQCFCYKRGQKVFVASGALDSNLKSAIRIQQQQQFPTASWASFEEYKNSRNSVWHLTIVNGKFNCNCPVFMKTNLCKHSFGWKSVCQSRTHPQKQRTCHLDRRKREAGPNLASLPFSVIDFSMTLAKLPVFNSF
jgi:hypothetical protein